MGRIHNILSEPAEITDSQAIIMAPPTTSPSLIAGLKTPGAPSFSPALGERVGATEIRGDIEFRNLHFRYGHTLKAAEKNNGRKHGDDDVLKDVNLRVPAGSS